MKETTSCLSVHLANTTTMHSMDQNCGHLFHFAPSLRPKFPCPMLCWMLQKHSLKPTTRNNHTSNLNHQDHNETQTKEDTRSRTWEDTNYALDYSCSEVLVSRNSCCEGMSCRPNFRVIAQAACCMLAKIRTKGSGNMDKILVLTCGCWWETASTRPCCQMTQTTIPQI